MSILLRRQLFRKFFCTGAAAAVGDLANPVQRSSPRPALPSSPCLLMPPSFVSRARLQYKAYSPVEDEILTFKNKGGAEEVSLVRDDGTIWVGTSHGWLALFNSCTMLLLNPVSGRRISLPPYRGDPFMDEEEGPFPLKVILSHSPEDDDCVALMILGSLDRAAFCRPGRCVAWSPVGRWYDSYRLGRKIMYGDFAYSPARRVFLGSLRAEADLYRTEEVELYEHPFMDLCKTLSAPPRAESDPGIEWRTFIVPDAVSGDIFMVRRYLIDEESVDYNIYRIDVDSGEFKLCSSLNDLVIFIGMNHSFTVKASTFPKLKPNSIYFSGIWYFHPKNIDWFDYHTKAYKPWLDLKPHERVAFHSVLPWFVPPAN